MSRFFSIHYPSSMLKIRDRDSPRRINFWFPLTMMKKSEIGERLKFYELGSRLRASSVRGVR
jgi:hypothetical protein